MNTEMNKYYCEIGGAPHRFDAINLYTAQIKAQRLAEMAKATVDSDPVRFDPVEHGKHFEDGWHGQ
jgi:hypothetical protein